MIIDVDYNEAVASGEPKGKYEKVFKMRGGRHKETVLHLASDKILVNVAEHFIKLYPGQVYVKSSVGGHENLKCIPL